MMLEAARRVWLLHIGEPLPVAADGERPLRMGLLAETLAAQGHDVLWWSSTFDHNHKRQIVESERRVAVRSNYALELLQAVAYPRNVSFRRFVNHLQIARRFSSRAAAAAPPDVILCTIPTVELAAAAVSYGRRAGVPVIVDIRDLWPDILLDLFPRAGRPVARVLLDPWFRASRRALASADALTAVSHTYLSWGLASSGRAPSSRDRVFPLGYPRPSVDPVAGEAAGRSLAERGVDTTRRLVWFVGMFGRTYDLSSVIKAARRLETQGVSDLQFVLSGAGDNDAKWRAEAASLSNVVFTGWVTAAEIAYLLGAAWVGLAAYSPGAPQSLPNKLFEYMSGALPVLSSLQGEAAELLRQHRCGLTYQPGDVEGIAATLLALRADPAWHQRLSDASRSTFESEFAADAVYSRMAEFVVARALPKAAGEGGPG